MTKYTIFYSTNVIVLRSTCINQKVIDAPAHVTFLVMMLPSQEHVLLQIMMIVFFCPFRKQDILA